MNFKRYYDRESKKSYWQRQKGLNRRLSGRREPWKKRDIRANFEIEITKKANPKGWLFNAYLMFLSFCIMLVAVIIMAVVEFQYAPMKSNTVVLVNGMMFFGLLGFILTTCVFGVVTRGRG